jgi:zinc transport system substrate-binding protein
MKRSLLALICVFLLLGLGSYGLIQLIGSDIEPYTKDSTHTIVTSFYPEYIIAKNLLDNCDDINLVNMTSETTGCLHDYQLTSKDMKILTTCDGLIINGGDMEPFIDDITKALPNLPIIDSSKGIKLLEGTHTHTHHHDDDCDDDCT